MKKIIAILIALLFTSGCSRQLSLNSQELELLGIKSWIVKIDKQPDKETKFTLLVVTPNGIRKGGSGPILSKNIKQIKVLLWDLDKKDIKFAIVGLDPEKKGIGPDTVGPCSFASQGTRENPFYGYEGATAYAIPGSTVKIGEIICKKSKTNRVSRINAPPEEDEIGLAFGYHE
jgi:hypothetical protein